VDRNTERRDKDIIPADKLDDLNVLVIGVGAIGGQVAKQLAHVGVRSLLLLDPDVVGYENLATQCFCEEDVGKGKAAVVAAECARINPAIVIDHFAEKFDAGHLSDGKVAVFMCVDDMNARIDIARTCSEELFVVDGRMTSEFLRVLTFTSLDEYKRYKKTLFGSEEAYQESCTAKATVYCANIAAGMMVAQFVKWLRGFPSTPDFELNILSLELYENDEDAKG
jgi:molybdopterin/thiamine biosynthesis adenylyltransferase